MTDFVQKNLKVKFTVISNKLLKCPPSRSHILHSVCAVPATTQEQKDHKSATLTRRLSASHIFVDQFWGRRSK